MIFAIFTAQAWNMAFSFYQSLRSVPRDLEEVTSSFHLSGWQRFWRLEVPFATPGLVWNTMLSMSGAWFFIVASEAISVGDTDDHAAGHRRLSRARHRPGRCRGPCCYACLRWPSSSSLYDQFIFRPIVAWADKFRVETTASQAQAEILALRSRSAHSARSKR